MSCPGLGEDTLVGSPVNPLLSPQAGPTAFFVPAQIPTPSLNVLGGHGEGEPVCWSSLVQ